MSDQPLSKRRILIVEDEYFLAQDAARELAAAGAEIVGSVASVAEAIEAVQAEPALDLAVLDVNLGGDGVYPVADALDARHVPLVFTTGYDRTAIQERYRTRPMGEKPMAPGHLCQLVEQALSH